MTPPLPPTLMEKMRAAMEAQEFELSEARKTYDHKLRELKAREDKIKVDLHVIEEDRAILDDKVAKFEEWCIRSQAKYDQEFKLAQALKDEYESKISKLKQAIG